MSDKAHHDITAFTEAYTAFNSALEQLASSQRDLESHFTTLNEQLQETNRRLQKSLADESQLNAYLESMLEGLGSGIVAVDTENRVTLINEAAAELLDSRPESVLHVPAETLLGETAGLLALTVADGNGAPEQERDLALEEDRTLPVRFKTACLRSRDGTILGALAIIDDLSHVRELSRQASRVNTLTALGEMSATVAHEIRNPLGGIGGFADVLARKLDSDDPRRRLVVKITEGIDRLNSVVSNLLTYTRPAQLNLRPVDFVEVVEDCVGFFEIDAGVRVDEIDVQRDYTIPELPCRIDPEQVQQIVLNLLHNAVQAIPGSGWVVFQTRDGRAKYPMFQGEEYQKNLDFVDRLQEVASEAKKTVAQVVINWTIHQPGITVAICGAKRSNQVADNAGAMGWQLSSIQLAQINRALEERGEPVTISPSPAMSARADGTPGRVE